MFLFLLSDIVFVLACQHLVRSTVACTRFSGGRLGTVHELRNPISPGCVILPHLLAYHPPPLTLKHNEWVNEIVINFYNASNYLIFRAFYGLGAISIIIERGGSTFTVRLS